MQRSPLNETLISEIRRNSLDVPQTIERVMAQLSLAEAALMEAATNAGAPSAPGAPGADLSAMRMSTLGDGHRIYVGLGEEPAAGSPLRVYVEFTDTANRPAPDVNYGVTVEQRGATLASVSGAHDSNADLNPIVVTTSPLRSGGSVDVTVEFGGFGRPGGELAGPVGNTVGFRQVRTVTPVTQADAPAPHLDRITISGVSVTDASGGVATREPVGEDSVA